MKVKLKRNWFGPDGGRYRERSNPHEMPDDWKAKLPPGAVVLEEPAPVKEKASKALIDKLDV